MVTQNLGIGMHSPMSYAQQCIWKPIFGPITRHKADCNVLQCFISLR